MKTSFLLMPLLFFLLVCVVPLSVGGDDPRSEPLTRQGSSDFTHGVLAEDLTATWCTYCPEASEGLVSIYESGDYPFYFVCLIDDMSDVASARVQDDYNIYGFPTVEFDGGFSENTGGGADKENDYRPLIEEAGARTDVADVDIVLNGYDDGDSTLTVTASVKNLGTGSYSGNLKVYITERVSRWLDYDGNPYPFALLDFAIDEDVSVDAGATSFTSATWTGSEHQDLNGDDYGDIDPNNIMLIGALFDTRAHPKHHSGSPNFYTAYYVDETVGSEIGFAKVEPSVDITYPSEGDELSGTIDITATVTGKEAIEKVEYEIDDGDWQAMMDGGNGGYSTSWDTTTVDDGDHTITVRAVDFLGLEDSQSIDVKVDQGVEPPPPPPPPPPDDDDDDDDDGPVVPPPYGESISISDVVTTISSGSASATPADEIYVSAKVTGDGIDGVQLVYTTSSGETSSKMRDRGNDVYEGSMGPFTANSVVSYHISVQDNFGKVHNGDTKTINIGEAESTTTDDGAPGFEVAFLIAALTLGLIAMGKKHSRT